MHFREIKPVLKDYLLSLMWSLKTGFTVHPPTIHNKLNNTFKEEDNSVKS